MAETLLTAFEGGFSSVPRFSSLFEYLQLCAEGVSIRSETLDCTLVKASDDGWSGHADRRRRAANDVQRGG